MQNHFISLVKSLSLQNILYHLQHGFHSRLSCETGLIQFIHDFVTYMQSGTQTDVIVMDFSKSFDKVNNKLIYKLHYFQGKTIRGSDPFCLIEPRVMIEGETSSEAPVTLGVPQGSVLSPCLFLF